MTEPIKRPGGAPLLPPRRPAPPVAADAPGDRLALAAGGIEPLPGGLNGEEMLHSNHPEILNGPGIAVSTLDLPGPAHLPHDFNGRFTIFCHHQNRAGRPLYQAVVLHNPGSRPVAVKLGASASFTTSEAPYRDGPAEPQADPRGALASGPGDKVAGALLRGERVVAAPGVTLAPGETRILYGREIPPRNEATSEFQLDAGGPVQAAVVITDDPPTDAGVAAVLQAGRRVPPNPGDLPPTPPGAGGALVYGRVAGVQRGTAWDARMAPVALAPGLKRQWIVDSKQGHDGGTGQVQAAPVTLRYPDAAYAAHGNYGVAYDLTVPLENPSAAPLSARLYLDSLPTSHSRVEPPLLQLWHSLTGYFTQLAGGTAAGRAYRGAVAVEAGGETRYLHLAQTLGQPTRTPLVSVALPPGAREELRLRLYYPADATAPHVLRLEAGP